VALVTNGLIYQKLLPKNPPGFVFGRHNHHCSGGIQKPSYHFQMFFLVT
jgi:hypothetical protein